MMRVTAIELKLRAAGRFDGGKIVVVQGTIFDER